MEILGIGPMELLAILLIMLIVLGPKDMIKTGRQVGLFIRKVIRSSAWQSMMNASREIREIPTRLVRESGFEEEIAEVRKLSQIPKEEIASLNRLAEEAFYPSDPEEQPPQASQLNPGSNGKQRPDQEPITPTPTTDDSTETE